MTKPKQTAEPSAQDQPVKVITLGSIDGPELLARYGAHLALAGIPDPKALALIARPAGATLH